METGDKSNLNDDKNKDNQFNGTSNQDKLNINDMAMEHS
jgi:hypothetical protein